MCLKGLVEGLFDNENLLLIIIIVILLCCVCGD